MELAILEETSEQFVGQWKRLVSTTNWDKGHILLAWRTALVEAGAAAAEFSDDTWSRQVGGVTPQHVGRLRRVAERFGKVRDTYAGLFWSHFQAALDWDDAEMWLEGAVQNKWSIADMRRTRWETLGSLAENKPQDDELATTEWDEDAEPDVNDELAGEAQHGLAGTVEVVRPARQQGAAEHDEAEVDAEDDEEAYDPAAALDDLEPVRPFANLAALPPDVSDAFEAFKLSILRHKLAGWAEVSRDDVIAALDGLRELALAPARE